MEQFNLLQSITWFGHDAFRVVAAGQVIYLDPFELPAAVEPADVVLITHEHFDHCSPADLARIVHPSTTVVAAATCGSTLEAFHARLVGPGEGFELGRLHLETVPAYNLKKDFHPRGESRVGYVLTLEGQRIYHAGDTDRIPEMADLRGIDLALMPVSGTYVMTAEEAAAAIDDFRPKLAIPMHYGSIVGTRDDAERFRRLASVPVTILERTR